jgi:hypothetical protein
LSDEAPKGPINAQQVHVTHNGPAHMHGNMVRADMRECHATINGREVVITFRSWVGDLMDVPPLVLLGRAWVIGLGAWAGWTIVTALAQTTAQVARLLGYP